VAVRRLARRFYALRALDEGVLLFPVYALLFADAGLSPGEISSLFVIWSIVSFGLEIPSGAWADTFSRRWLLAIGAILRAIGFATWVLWPTYAGFAIGFVLWGIRSATSSGTREALVYDELAAINEADQYTRIMGRSGTAAMLAMLAATALAAPAYTVGGYLLVGAGSVAVSLGSAAVAWSFPETPRVELLDGSGWMRYMAQFRAGLSEVHRERVVRRILVISCVVSGLSALDEYLPLLARALGSSPAAVAVLLLAPYGAMAVGSWSAGRFARATPGQLAAALGVAAVSLAAGSLVAHPAGMIGIAVSFGVLEFAMVLLEARLQDSIAGTARATVLSVSGFGSEVVALIIYVGYGVAAHWFDVTTLVAAVGAPLMISALLARKWLPRMS
jgi:MFS family permease